MSDIVDILGIDKSEEIPKETKKSKKETKKDPYATLPRYLRDLVSESNPPPDFVFEEKKSVVLLFLLILQRLWYRKNQLRDGPIRNSKVRLEQMVCHSDIGFEVLWNILTIHLLDSILKSMW